MVVDRVVLEGAFDNAACSSRGVLTDGRPLLIMRVKGLPRGRLDEHGQCG